MILDCQCRGNVNLLSSVDVPKEMEKHCFNDAENCIGNEEKEKHQKIGKSDSPDARVYSNYSTTNCQYVWMIEIL